MAHGRRVALDITPVTKNQVRIERSIDGKPAVGMTLEMIRVAFRQPRRKYMISVERNGSPMQIKLTTRRVI